MPTPVFLSPIGNGFNFLDENGRPLNQGRIYTYLAGTTTPQATYTTVDGDTQNDNPIELGVDGRPPNEIWFVQGVTYKFILRDSLDNLIDTYDDLPGINDTSGGDATFDDVTINGDLLGPIECNWVLSAPGAIIVTGESDYKWYPRFDGTFEDTVMASVVATSADPLTFDVLINGTSIFTTTITIAANQNTSLTATQPVVNASAASFSAGDEVTFEVTDAGDDLAEQWQIGAVVRKTGP